MELQSDCSQCIYFYYESDTNYGECQNDEANELYADVEDMTKINYCPYYDNTIEFDNEFKENVQQMM